MGCPQNSSASSVALHTTSLSPNSFFLSLTSTSACNPLRPFCALLDLGSSHSFVNEAFAVENKLKFSYLPNPIPLKMFDGVGGKMVQYVTHLNRPISNLKK